MATNEFEITKVITFIIRS